MVEFTRIKRLEIIKKSDGFRPIFLRLFALKLFLQFPYGVR